MKTFNTFVGIDISKLTIDVCIIHDECLGKTQYFKVANNIKAVHAFVIFL